MRDLAPEAARLLAAYYPLFRRWVVARQRLFPHLDVEIEDAAWCGFLAACRKWDPARCPNFATYLHKCLLWRKPYRLQPGRGVPIPVSLDVVRGGGRCVGRDDDHAPEPMVPEPAAPAAADPGDLIDLAEAMACLPAEDRELLDLLYRDDLGQRRAGRHLGRPRTTVADHHALILDRLRERMAAS